MSFSYSRLRDPDQPLAMVLPIKVSDVNGKAKREVRVMIDTGACISVLPEAVINELNVKQCGTTKPMGGIDGPKKPRQAFLVKLQVGSRPACDARIIVECRSIGLLGRDVLNQFVLHADGPAKLFDLA